MQLGVAPVGILTVGAHTPAEEPSRALEDGEAERGRGLHELFSACERPVRRATLDLAAYARRKGVSVRQAERWLGPSLAYDPD